MGHKIVRHRSPVVLLLVDVVNHFEFPDGEAILKNALLIAPRLARLKKRARDSNIPVIYVNDNFGQWRSDAGKLLAHCLRTDCAGKPFVEAIQPGEQDYCVPQTHAFGVFSDAAGSVAPTPWRLVHYPRGDCHEQLHIMHGA
jgi:nicotinamidase-related amidase